MGKVENNEVREYLLDFASSKLNDCDLFAKTFGKNFARKKLELNVEKVYTNEFNSNKNGYHNFADSSITICTEEKDSKPLSVEEIENSKSLKATILHESLHAILMKTRIYCMVNKIRSGTGILEFYNNKNELGRGLNEGLTNWIVKKAGIPIHSYEELTQIMEMLEIAIGEERVMKMARGNIRGNVAKQLDMHLYECQAFLAGGDEIYYLGEKENNLNEILSILNKKSQNDPEVEEEYENLEKNELYIRILNSRDYKKALKETKLQDDIDTRIAYFETIIESNKEKIDKHINELAGLIFNKYLAKDFKKLEGKKDISSSDLEKYDELYEYIIRNELEIPQLDEFMEEYENLDLKYFKSVCAQAKEEFENGNLSGEKIEELEQLTNRGRYSVNAAFFYKISKYICPEDSKSAYELLCLLDNYGDIENISQYSIGKLTVEGKQYNVYLKNGEIVSLNNNLKIDKVKTHEYDVDEILLAAEIMEKAKKINPNSEIEILDMLSVDETDYGENYYTINNDWKLVVCKNKNGNSYYMAKDDNLVLLDCEKMKAMSLNLTTNNKELPTLQKKGLFKRLSTSIKRKIFQNKVEDIIYIDEDKESKRDNFKDIISDMSQYSRDKTGNISNLNEKNDIERIE